MNHAFVFKLTGTALKALAAFLIAPLVVSIIARDGGYAAFVPSMLSAAAVGFPLSELSVKRGAFRARDAFAAAALSWILFSLFGALPFYFSGCFGSFSDCLFESVSGFTTTGATVLTDVETLPRGLQFWRCFTQWLGGVGVLIFMIAILPETNASSVNLFRVEATGPAPDRLAARVRTTARVLYLIYLIITAAAFVAFLAAGVPAYDAFLHALTTAGTGGFSPNNSGPRAYGNAAQVVAAVFMLLSGINFSVYFHLFTGNFKRALRNEELRLYLIFSAAAAVTLAINSRGAYGSVSEAIRASAYDAASAVSTSGFPVTSAGVAPAFSRFVLMFLMFAGACSGSTGGGVKFARLLVLAKAVRIEIDKIIHPKSVKAVTVDGGSAERGLVTGIALFFVVYFAFLFAAAALVSLDCKDVGRSFSAVFAALSNTGIDLTTGAAGAVGAAGAAFNPFSKLALCVCMLAGRLEFYPVMILFIPTIWKRGTLA